jgi:F0F1-type ATP synthase alpha subunit
MGEMVDIHGVRGLILNIEPKFVKVVVFADDSLIYQGDVVIKLNDLMLAPVG